MQTRAFGFENLDIVLLYGGLVWFHRLLLGFEFDPHIYKVKPQPNKSTEKESLGIKKEQNRP